MEEAILSTLLKAGSKAATKSVEEKATTGGVLNNLLSYKRSNKELRNAINNRIYESNPELFDESGYEGALLGEGGTTDIPRIHVDDLKHYFGHTQDIPSRYKRTTGKRDIDELAALAGYDRIGGIDDYMDSIKNELDRRVRNRDNVMKLREMRNDPKFIKETKDMIDKEKAYYAPDTSEPYQPNKREYNWYLKNVLMKEDQPKKTGMENFKINWNDGSKDKPYKVPKAAKKYLDLPVPKIADTSEKPISKTKEMVKRVEKKPIAKLKPRVLKTPLIAMEKLNIAPKYNAIYNVLAQSGLNSSRN